MYKLNSSLVAAAGVSLLLLSNATSAAVSKTAVLEHYADLAQAMYADSLSTAQGLQKAVQQLVQEPTHGHLSEAKLAWKAARVPYQQTEVYRFGNAIVDEWEGKVNAWPLDEGLIDYVAASYGAESDENSLYTANVIANKSLQLSGTTIDTSNITPALLANTLHEVDGVEANVATGYHAIEFLLWGQDLNGTGQGAGGRSASDYNVKDCSWGNCDRRGQYLLAASELLISDLQWMHAQWRDDGAARQTLLQNPDAGITAIFTGMGSLSYGELAGERIKLGVLLHDPEEEHDCFSDNTHNSHYYDILGIQNVYIGQYTTVAGQVITGPSVADLLVATAPTTDKALRQNLTASLLAANELVVSAEQQGVAYDQLLAEGNTAGNAKIMRVVEALLVQTKSIETAIADLKLAPIEFEGSDSLDAPAAVFQ